MAFLALKPAPLGITCHAFSPEGKLAVCPNSSELHIYSKGPTGVYALEAKLVEHDILISGVDWCRSSNRIVTCSHDRNAFVWTLEPDEEGVERWNPALVILRIDMSATDVRWSPGGLKFAVASGAKCVSVCSFDDTVRLARRSHRNAKPHLERKSQLHPRLPACPLSLLPSPPPQEKWWVSKMIKKHKSTVMCLAWHPNSQVIATGSTDFKVVKGGGVYLCVCVE